MNDLDATFYALLEIWDELPRLIGSEYASVFPRLLEKLEDVHDAPAAERDLYLVEVLDLLEPFPVARRSIRGARKTTERIRSDAHARGEAPFFDDPSSLYGPALCERVRPSRVVRYTDVTAPRRLPVGERGVITVGLVEDPAHDSVESKALELLFDRQVDVHLIAVSPEFEILNTKVQQLDVRLEAGAPRRAVFFVRGKSSGSLHLRLDFLQVGELLASLPISIEVTPEATEELHEQVALKLDTQSLQAAPCDLEFRVTMADVAGATRLHYTLHSPTGALDAFYLDVDGPKIVGSAEAYQKQLFTSLEEMVTDKTAHRRLVGIGEKIFDELLPDTVKVFFDELDPKKIRTVHIASDEPWIPWELLRLRVPQPAFWSERFVVTRWLAGETTPLRSAKLSHVAWIEIEGLGLSGGSRKPAADQKSLFALAKAAGAETKDLRAASLIDVEDLLDGDSTDFWHIKAPSHPSSDDHTVGLQLESGTLWPTDFDHDRCQRISGRGSLVFLNVGDSARLNFSLTGLDGWAPVWVQKCHCSGFIAPICQVDDDVGRHFSRVFYEALGGGATFGESVRKARLSSKDKDKANPAWAVYSAYGHPNARIAFSAAKRKNAV